MRLACVGLVEWGLYGGCSLECIRLQPGCAWGYRAAGIRQVCLGRGSSW